MLTKNFMMVLFWFREGDCEIMKPCRAFYTKVCPLFFTAEAWPGRGGVVTFLVAGLSKVLNATVVNSNLYPGSVGSGYICMSHPFIFMSRICQWRNHQHSKCADDICIFVHMHKSDWIHFHMVASNVWILTFEIGALWWNVKSLRVQCQNNDFGL